MKRPSSCLEPIAAETIPPLHDDDNPFPTTFEAGRKLMAKLDKRPPHTVYHGGESRSLTPREMQQFYTRRRLHMVGSVELNDWASNASIPTQDEVGAGYFFAHYPGKKLPRTFLDGICSAVDNAQFDEVVLMTYAKLSNVPDGVVELDANAFLAYERFEYLLKKGFRLVHLADWIRIMAMEATKYKRAVFVDGDTIWLKKAVPNETYHGFWFATLGANKVMPHLVPNRVTDN